MLNIRYILAACNNGQKKLGVELAPKLLLDTINKSVPKVHSTIIPSLFNTSKGYKKLYNNTKEILNMNKSAVILGGDHSISCSTVPAFFDTFKEKGVVLWIDAHPDINTPTTTFSGNLHGMPVASFLGLMKPVIIGNYLPKPNQIIYIGIRDIDPPEKKFINKLGIKYYTSEDLSKDISKVTTEINQIVKDSKIHISFDVDSIDPIFINSTGTIVENGLDLIQIKTIVDTLELKNLKCLDFVEYNPLINKTDFNSNLSTCAHILNMFN